MQWVKPSSDMVKANSDANLQVSGVWGLGGIFRNELGLVMAAATWNLPGQDDAAMAEAYALLSTVRLAVDYDFRRVIFEGDNKRLMQRILDLRKQDKSYFGSIVKEIQQHQKFFNLCLFSYIPRLGNSVAHSLARLAHSKPNRVWIEEVPNDINEVYFHIK